MKTLSERAGYTSAKYDKSKFKFIYDFFRNVYSETSSYFDEDFNPNRCGHAVYVTRSAVLRLVPRLRSIILESDDYKIFYHVDHDEAFSSTFSEMPASGNIEQLLSKVLKDARLKQILG